MEKKKSILKKGEGIFYEFYKNRAGYSLLIPAVIYTFIFSYMTIPYMIIAFEDFKYNTGIRSPFIGLDNFKFFFNSPNFWRITRNTLGLNFGYIIFDTLLALVIAIFINEMSARKYAKTIQSSMLLPHFLSWVIISYLLYAFLSSEYGLINRILMGVGKEKINWYNNASYWPFILILVHALKSAGYNSIIYLASITGIDKGIYESAMIDGCTRWKRIWHITIPLLMPTVCILVLMSIGRLMFGDFSMYYAIIKDNGILLETTDVIDTYVFRMLRTTGNPAVSMAVGLYQSVIGFIMVFVANRLTKKFFPEGALF